jgi:hypothetical protein
MTVSTFAEKIALELLACNGDSVVWQLHLAAATAYRDENARAADALVEIADAAERQVASRCGYSTVAIAKYK